MPNMQIVSRLNGAILMSGSYATLVAMMEYAAAHSVNLSNSQLSYMYFDRNCDQSAFPRALGGANLTGLNLSNSALIGKDFNRITTGYDGSGNPIYSATNLSSANFTGAKMRCTRLCFVTLTGTNFTNADLTGAEMYGNNFTAATLTGANLHAAYLGGCNFANLNLSNMRFQRAFLRFADFSGTNLAGADMRGADLYGAVFNNGTNLSGTDLRDARNFDHAVTAGANLSSIITSGGLPTYSYPSPDYPTTFGYDWYW